MTIEHDCPWVGDCGCTRDGSLCACSHQRGDHGNAPMEYIGSCTQCECQRFTAEAIRSEEEIKI